VVLALGTAGQLAAQISVALLPPSASITASAVDANGFIYLAGNLSTGDLATTPGVFEPVAPRNICDQSDGQPVYCSHGFVVKLPPAGNSLLWATYLAGNGEDTISALAVDANGRVFAAGSTTSTALMFMSNPFAPPPYTAVPASLFLYALTSEGSLLGGTFFGGAAQDSIVGLAPDAGGDVIIAGTANSDPFPTTPGAYQTTRDAGYSDQFVAEFNPSFTRLVFSTLIGGTEQYTASVLALGPDGTIYVGGTEGTLRGVGVAGPILTRLGADGASIVYAKFFQQESGVYSLAVDADSNVYFGEDSRVFGEATPSGIVTKLDAQGNQTASREIDGSLYTIALGPTGGVSVFGLAQVGVLTTSPGAPNPCMLPGYGVWVLYAAQLDAQLNIQYAEFVRNAIALAGPGDVLEVSGYPAPNSSFSVVPIGPAPAQTITCMANAADYNGSTIAPGELLAVFGNQIGPDQPMGAQLDAMGNVTSNLGGFSVLIGGLPAPLLYASTDQINLVAPFGIPSTGQVQVELRQNGTVLSSFDQLVSAQNPGLFTSSGTGMGQLAALNQDGTINGPSNPAHPGQIVTVFATGLGAMTPQPIDGSRPPQPVDKPVAPAQVLVSGNPAQIDYSGNAPDLVQGVVQINFLLPADLSPQPNGVIVVLQGSPAIGGSGGSIVVH
jgi:uncharacterized protein (TIGR03437 family)